MWADYVVIWPGITIAMFRAISLRSLGLGGGPQIPVAGGGQPNNLLTM